jgi:hypothetical protein
MRLVSARSTVSSRKKAESLRATACARRACTSWPSGVASGSAKAVVAVRLLLAGRLAQPLAQPIMQATSIHRHRLVHEGSTGWREVAGRRGDMVRRL